jgi:2-oxoisovalerate dehydrogenase E1 component
MMTTTAKSRSKLPAGVSRADLLRLYERMMLLRRFESVAQDLNKKGVWPGFLHLYLGEEAVAVGVCDHLKPTDWITSTHRGHGHALAKSVSPGAMMAELYGKATGVSGGRGGSLHMYCPEVGLLGTNGLVGGGIPLAVGAALSAKVRKSPDVGVAFFGDGAVNHGAFLESLNFAAIQKLPVLFVCENNLYATATPLRIATANTEVAQRAAAFGAVGVAVDGNDVVDVWRTAKEAVDRARAGQGPTLIEAKTYRWCGHHEGDPVCGTYRTEEELAAWKKRCPVQLMRKRLIDQWRIATSAELDEIDRAMQEKIEAAVRFGDAGPMPDVATLHAHVLADPINPPIPSPSSSSAPPTERGWMEAVRDGIAEEMRRDPHIAYLGEGIGERGGSFGHTKNLWHEFGGGRVIDTPICELAFTGAAAGASATGCRTVADLMFADFLWEAGSQIVQQAAKLRYLSNGKVGVPMVVRAPMGMIKCAAAHHSGAYYPSFAHVPGLIVAVPSTPADAKGMIKTALRAGDPVLFLEHKALFGSRGPVPAGEHLVPFGQAAVVREGRHLTIATCGLLTRVCLEAAAQLEQQGISCEVIDLRTIVPLDVQTVAASVRKTLHLLVVDEAWSMFGVGAELAAAMMELAFDYLDAPIGRLHTQCVPFPFSPPLDAATAVSVPKVLAAARSVMAGKAPQPVHPRGIGSTPRAPAMAAAPAAPAAPAAASMAAVSVDGVPIVMPNMDLTTESAKLVRWLKNVGDRVSAGEAVLEVETDKAVVDVESPAAGILAQTLAKVDDVVALGKPVGIIKPL